MNRVTHEILRYSHAACSSTRKQLQLLLANFQTQKSETQNKVKVKFWKRLFGCSKGTFVCFSQQRTKNSTIFTVWNKFKKKEKKKGHTKAADFLRSPGQDHTTRHCWQILLLTTPSSVLISFLHQKNDSKFFKMPVKWHKVCRYKKHVLRANLFLRRQKRTLVNSII